MPYYVQDAAYHNGIVWTWLGGTWIDHAAAMGNMNDVAFSVTLNMVRQILDRGAVGTLSELVDAAPRKGETEPQLSGAYSQAWSLAEFVRTIYQSYLGVKVKEMGSVLSLNPNLPSQIQFADFNVPVGLTTVQVQYRRAGDSLIVTLLSPVHGKEIIVSSEFTPKPPKSVHAPWFRYSGTAPLAANSSMTLIFTNTGIVQHTAEGDKQVSTRSFASGLGFIALATPVVRPDLKALKGPDHPLLKNSEIKQAASSASVLYDVADPAGDDKGTGAYVYPKSPSLKPGSLDITHFTVSADAKNVYFKLVFDSLSDPGWHPEYGFQLTYAAIAIDKDGKSGSGQTKAGMNAQYSFNKEFAFENILYVGGGIQIQDAKGTILAEYIPVPGDEGSPLGSISTKTIEFSIPVSVLGQPQKGWRYAVLIGAQDDHGGSGIGDFRNVELKESEWTGGGKKKPDASNVYDTILPRKSK